MKEIESISNIYKKVIDLTQSEVVEGHSLILTTVEFMKRACEKELLDQVKHQLHYLELFLTYCPSETRKDLDSEMKKFFDANGYSSSICFNPPKGLAVEVVWKDKNSPTGCSPRTSDLLINKCKKCKNFRKMNDKKLTIKGIQHCRLGNEKDIWRWQHAYVPEVCNQFLPQNPYAENPLLKKLLSLNYSNPETKKSISIFKRTKSKRIRNKHFNRLLFLAMKEKSLLR